MTGDAFEHPVLAAVESALRAHFGRAPERASLSLVGVEPIEVLRFTLATSERAYASLGMSRAPMAPDSALVDAAGGVVDGPRAELLLRVRDRHDAAAGVWRSLAILAAAPTVEGVVYRDGASVDLGEPLCPGSRCTGMVIVAGDVAAVPTSLGEVVVLDAVPATPDELAWTRVHGSAALRARWATQATDLLDLSRASVRLD